MRLLGIMQPENQGRRYLPAQVTRQANKAITFRATCGDWSLELEVFADGRWYFVERGTHFDEVRRFEGKAGAS